MEPIGWRHLRGGKSEMKNLLRKETQDHVSMNKWNNTFTELDWKKIYNKVYKTSVDVKLRWFQMRLLYLI